MISRRGFGLGLLGALAASAAAAQTVGPSTLTGKVIPDIWERGPFGPKAGGPIPPVGYQVGAVNLLSQAVPPTSHVGALGRAGLVDGAESRYGAGSFWFRQAAGSPGLLLTSGADATFVNFTSTVSAGSFVSLFPTVADFSKFLDAESLAIPDSTSWTNVLWSFDTTAGLASIYAGETNILDTIDVSSGPFLADFFSAQFGVAISGTGSMDISEFWYDDAQYVDFTNSVNRAKFHSAGVKPVDLGATGAAPFGTAPELFLHLASGAGSASGFLTNNGTGGDLSLVKGTLSVAGTSPSD